MDLASLKERLNNPKLSGLERSQREVFVSIIKQLNFRKDAENITALSVSVGDGVWDYLTFLNNPKIKKIVATDIVDNPVKPEDVSFLRELGAWEFIKVEREARLPFENESFDLIFHQDVVEHAEKPYLFIADQYRILKKGGVLLFGTPNLFRPANIVKLIFGKLHFPNKIGYNRQIGDYIHIQEFYEQQMKIMLRETGFNNIFVFNSFFGLYFLNLTFALHPKSNLGKDRAHYLTFVAKK